ncbi:MAG: hypothetical protein BWY84_01118 [Candidatus Aerophobetes bacterium ADurb.Bin490]|nr:MAG: hypothetical protein BWY84_01118 [Candidatus Aerophobetes bacterium ADurb.Bin490]
MSTISVRGIAMSTARRVMVASLYLPDCALHQLSNEGVAEKFLESVDGFKQVAVTENSKFSNFIKKKYFVSLPGNEMNMDGFFIARFMKK